MHGLHYFAVRHRADSQHPDTVLLARLGCSRAAGSNCHDAAILSVTRQEKYHLLPSKQPDFPAVVIKLVDDL